jgi:CcmD family protein
MSGGDYLAAAYAVVFVTILLYVVIIAAKLARLERETGSSRAGARADDG